MKIQTCIQILLTVTIALIVTALAAMVLTADGLIVLALGAGALIAGLGTALAVEKRDAQA